MADKITSTSLTFGINEHTWVSMDSIVEMMVNIEQAKAIISTFALLWAGYDHKVEQDDAYWAKFDEFEPNLQGIMIKGYRFYHKDEEKPEPFISTDRGSLHMEGSCFVARFCDNELGVEDSEVLVHYCIKFLSNAGVELPEEVDLLEDYIKNGMKGW